MDNQTPPAKLLRLSDVLQRVGLRRSAWYAGIKEGRFPKPVKLTPRTSAWLESEIDDLIQQKIEGRI